MRFARVGIVQQGAFIPATPVATVFAPYTLLPGFMLVVGVASTTTQSAFTVTDDAPGGGTAYMMDNVQPVAIQPGTTALYWGVLGVGVANLTVSVVNGDTTDFGGWVTLAIYRRAGAIFKDVGQGVQSPFGQISAGPLSLAVPHELGVAMGIVVLARSMFGDGTPIVSQAVGHDFSIGYGFGYGDALDVSGTPTFTLDAHGPGETAMSVATHGVPLPPPPPHTPGSCFAGGVQPSPVYRKEDYPFSRGLRRRLRREGFHV